MHAVSTEKRSCEWMTVCWVTRKWANITMSPFGFLLLRLFGILLFILCAHIAGNAKSLSLVSEKNKKNFLNSTLTSVLLLNICFFLFIFFFSRFWRDERQARKWLWGFSCEIYFGLVFGWQEMSLSACHKKMTEQF